MLLSSSLLDLMRRQNGHGLVVEVYEDKDQIYL